MCIKVRKKQVHLVGWCPAAPRCVWCVHFYFKKNGRKQNPPKSSKFTICLTPSRKYHRSNSHGSQWTWQRCCHPWHNMGMWTIRCQSKKSGDVPPPEARHKEYKREREKSIKLFIYLFIKETKNQFIYLSVYLFVYLSVCQRNQMHLFDIEHRICMDMSQTACQPQPKRGLVTSCVSSISLVASHPNTQLDTQHLLLPNRWKCISPRDARRNGK